MGKRDLLTGQVLSPALAVLRACAGHPKCQRTDQQLAADGEDQKKLRPWAAFCAVFWVLCLDQRQVLFWQVQSYIYIYNSCKEAMDGWMTQVRSFRLRYLHPEIAHVLEAGRWPLLEAFSSK